MERSVEEGYRRQTKNRDPRYERRDVVDPVRHFRQEAWARRLKDKTQGVSTQLHREHRVLPPREAANLDPGHQPITSLTFDEMSGAAQKVVPISTTFAPASSTRSRSALDCKADSLIATT